MSSHSLRYQIPNPDARFSRALHKTARYLLVSEVQEGHTQIFNRTAPGWIDVMDIVKNGVSRRTYTLTGSGETWNLNADTAADLLHVWAEAAGMERAG